jgi:hypothetical protein
VVVVVVVVWSVLRTRVQCKIFDLKYDTKASPKTKILPLAADPLEGGSQFL